MKRLVLRRPDVCVSCRDVLPAGTRAVWDTGTRTVRCRRCAPVEPPRQAPSGPPQDAGRAGGSAAREFERRVTNRESRMRSEHPKLAGLLLALSNDPSSTRVWAQGAAGEVLVGAALDELRGEHVAVLHDRALRSGGRSRANIDHIAVAASGVWVIDAKTHRGALEVRRSGGIFGPRIERLFIGGRDRTKLVDGLASQVVAVGAELLAVGADVPVRGALCFVGTELPWFGSSSIAGVPLVGRRGLAKLLKGPGPLAPADRRAIAEFLSTRFVPAVR